MLRRLFSLFGSANATTIALAADGIAICESGKTPILLVGTNTCYESRLALINALKSVATNIKAKQLRFVISNHFVRYGVLPWQEGIISRQDWLALAQHDFRKRFGAVADQWQMRVSLNGYEKSVASCAIDQALLDDLQALAQSQQWQIVSIEPLLMRILSAKKSTQKNMPQNAWIVIAEPERVLLCEANKQEWQRFTLISPPSGQEAQQTTQQIMRSWQNITQISTNLIQQKPKEVLAFIAPSLINQAQTWVSDTVSMRVIKTASTPTHQTNSALWIASLWDGILTMPSLDLNFAQSCRRFSQPLMLILAVVFAVIAGALFYQQQALTQQIESKTNTSTNNIVTKSVAAPSPALLHSTALAHETQHALNIAWLPMLKALEQVQQANPQIKLLSIHPNPSKSEIVLTGQTAKFDDLVGYQNSLNSQTALGEAVLLNQRSDTLASDDANTVKSVIGFTLAVGWKP